MRGPHNLYRIGRAAATFERTGALRVVLHEMNAPRSIRVAARIIGWPLKFFGDKGQSDLPPVIRAIYAMGPVYVKFGQLLSTRPDVVGPKLADELRILQDQLPPFPTATAKRTIEQELGKPIDTIFSDFDDPVAVGSIAQVHRARLRSDDSVVAVKVLRPDTERAFRRDIDAFYVVASLIELLLPKSRRLRPSGVIAHFESVVKRELDLRIEAAAATAIEAAQGDQPLVVIPTVHWQLSDRRVLTSDWANGINFKDVGAMREAGIDLPDLARRLIQLFLRQALRDGHFHADMHQGNLFAGYDGSIIMVDFGIVGRIDRYTRRVYAEILMGFIRRDYQRVAKVHFEAGYVPPEQDIDDFALALRSVGEPIFGMDASGISMARLLSRLFEVTERFGMPTRTELILLQRSMVVVEGVARSIDPRINMWTAARPVVEPYVRDNVGPVAFIEEMATIGRMLSRFGPQLPKIVETALRRSDGKVNQPPPGESSAHPLKLFIAGAFFGIVSLIVIGWLT